MGALTKRQKFPATNTFMGCWSFQFFKRNRRSGYSESLGAKQELRMAAPIEVSYITAPALLNLCKSPNVAIIDVRDEERSLDAHIAGSFHYASDTFFEKIPSLAEHGGKRHFGFPLCVEQGSWANLCSHACRKFVRKCFCRTI